MQLLLTLYSSPPFLFPMWSWAPCPCWSVDPSSYNFIAAEKPQEDESGSCCQGLGEGWKVMEVTRLGWWCHSAIQKLQACGLNLQPLPSASSPGIDCFSSIGKVPFLIYHPRQWEEPLYHCYLPLYVWPFILLYRISSLPLFSSAAQTHPKWSMWSYSYAEQRKKKSSNDIWCESGLKGRDTI